MPAAIPLMLRLTLATNVCVRGESVPFEITLENVSEATYQDLRTFSPRNEALHVVARKAGLSGASAQPPESPDLNPSAPQPGTYLGCALSTEIRDGIHRHGPAEPERTNLAPRGKLQTKGDVLAWLGELAPGDYELKAQHQLIGSLLFSTPVSLRVLPANPVAQATALRADASPESDLVAAWIHDTGKERLVFAQVQSPRLPKNPYRALRVASVSNPGSLFPADLPVAQAKRGHLFWLDGSKLRGASFDVAGDQSPRPFELRPAPSGPLLLSPLSMPDGSAFIPYTDNARKTVSIIHANASGQGQAHEIELGKSSPVGPYFCLWELQSKLHFIWTTVGGREVREAQMFLEQPSAEKPTRSLFVSDNPIIWLHAFLDHHATMAAEPGFEHNAKEEDHRNLEVPAPKLRLWCVARRGDDLLATLATPQENKARTNATFNLEKIQGAQVLSSVLTKDFQLGLLLADSQGHLYYASTSTGNIRPVDEIVGRRVTVSDQPLLMAASELGSLSWVYLRYMERSQGRLAYVLLEPSGEKDPEYSHQH